MTAQAFKHALELINMYYPNMPEEMKNKRAAELAEKICKTAKTNQNDNT